MLGEKIIFYWQKAIPTNTAFILLLHEMGNYWVHKILTLNTYCTKKINATIQVAWQNAFQDENAYTKCSPLCLVHCGKSALMWYQSGSSPRSERFQSICGMNVHHRAKLWPCQTVAMLAEATGSCQKLCSRNCCDQTNQTTSSCWSALIWRCRHSAAADVDLCLTAALVVCSDLTLVHKPLHPSHALTGRLLPITRAAGIQHQRTCSVLLTLTPGQTDQLFGRKMFRTTKAGRLMSALNVVITCLHLHEMIG